MIVLERIATGETVLSWPRLPASFACDLGEVNGAAVGWEAGGLRLVAIPDPPPPETPLADVIARRVAEAWQMAGARNEGGSVTVTTSAGTHAYGTDRITQDNIAKVLIGVLTGVTPNPRPWTPQGALAPVQLSHDDLKAVGAAVMARVDGLIQAYLAHKAWLMTPGRTRTDIETYDLSAGWPT